ncbi:hypothetical protein OIU77_025351 [Salix suchowensis]|uniref:Uncharacterized protein n=1 Tax=Salix suchowensis TaxID=1278906 RepID=A0ABQ9C0A6_9ROSI|nr:hypothetical protein OIU77_025351 [Salix suchowensis]
MLFDKVHTLQDYGCKNMEDPVQTQLEVSYVQLTAHEKSYTLLTG